VLDDDVQSGRERPIEEAVDVASLDERVAYLERRMEVHTAIMADLRGSVRGIRTDLTALRTEMHQRFERMEQRFERVDQRFDLLEQKFGLIDQKFDGKLDRLDQKIDRHFMWLIGMFATLLLALFGLGVQVARLQSL
jgi:hypothetical protein